MGCNHHGVMPRQDNSFFLSMMNLSTKTDHFIGDVQNSSRLPNLDIGQEELVQELPGVPEASVRGFFSTSQMS